jgi:hypothetical protein
MPGDFKEPRKADTPEDFIKAIADENHDLVLGPLMTPEEFFNTMGALHKIHAAPDCPCDYCHGKQRYER